MIHHVVVTLERLLTLVTVEEGRISRKVTYLLLIFVYLCMLPKAFPVDKGIPTYKTFMFSYMVFFLVIVNVNHVFALKTTFVTFKLFFRQLNLVLLSMVPKTLHVDRFIAASDTFYYAVSFLFVLVEQNSVCALKATLVTLAVFFWERSLLIWTTI